MRHVGAAGLALLLLVLIAVAPASGQPAQIGQVKTAAGVATIVRDKARLPAKPGDPVYQSDVIETGPDGSIGITFIDNSVFSTGPNSQLALTEYRFDVSTLAGSMLAELRKGTLTVVSGDITHHTPGAMRIKTPTTILGVRGTTFAIEVH
jgi:hypothetical protein